jgi:hypothetical protein
MSEDLERPWEWLGLPRRDCEPHRGEVLYLLGNLSLICGLLSLCTLVPSLIGLPLGLVVAFLARRDLDEMSTGRMDPGGRDHTEMARIRSAYAIVLCLLSWPVAPFLLLVKGIRGL